MARAVCHGSVVVLSILGGIKGRKHPHYLLLQRGLARPSAGMIYPITAQLPISLSRFQSPEHILPPEHSRQVKFRAMGV